MSDMEFIETLKEKCNVCGYSQTRLAQKKMNPKNLQYIMGHSSITITLDLYAHSSETGTNVEMRSLIA